MPTDASTWFMIGMTVGMVVEYILVKLDLHRLKKEIRRK